MMSRRKRKFHDLLHRNEPRQVVEALNEESAHDLFRKKLIEIISVCGMTFSNFIYHFLVEETEEDICNFLYGIENSAYPSIVKLLSDDRFLKYTSSIIHIIKREYAKLFESNMHHFDFADLGR